MQNLEEVEFLKPHLPHLFLLPDQNQSLSSFYYSLTWSDAFYIEMTYDLLPHTRHCAKQLFLNACHFCAFFFKTSSLTRLAWNYKDEAFPFFFLIFIYLFIHFWLCWVFVSVRGLSLVAASGGHSSSRCAGLSLLRPLLLRSTGSRRAGSVVVAHRPSCSAACGILPDQGSNPCPLH